MSSPRSPLESALDRALGAYARHLLTGERKLPTFRARFDGPRVLVDVDAPEGVQHYAWSTKHVPPFLAEVKKGALDNGKRLTKAQRAARLECLAWFAGRL